MLGAATWRPTIKWASQRLCVCVGGGEEGGGGWKEGGGLVLLWMLTDRDQQSAHRRRTNNPCVCLQRNVLVCACQPRAHVSNAKKRQKNTATCPVENKHNTSLNV